MSDPAQPYSDDLREFYYSNPRGKVAVDTLEFRHPAFVDDDGNPAAARFVNDHTENFVGTLEADAPMDAGIAVTFANARFDVTLPESNSPGLPSCQIAVDNIGRLLMENLNLAVASPNPIMVTYRQFLVDDPSEPGVVIDGMSIWSVNATALRVTATAAFEDDLNTPFGRKKYTPEEYPGLVR